MLALTLLVAWVLTDNHDNATATNHLALVTDFLHARFYLHYVTFRREAAVRLLVAVDDPTAR